MSQAEGMDMRAAGWVIGHIVGDEMQELPITT
jgi:hypothetical protein